MTTQTEVLVRNRGRVRRGLLVRETDKRMLVKLAYLSGRKTPRIAETWVMKSTLKTVLGNEWTAVGCIADPLPAGQVSAEITAIKKKPRSNTMPRIQFTRPQAAALQHRLDLWDSFAEVFADTDGLEHLAPFAAARAQELAQQLERCCYVDAKPDALDREILREAVEGSTWPAVHDPRGGEVSQQAYDGACRALWNAWTRIAAAYGLDPKDVQFPQG